MLTRNEILSRRTKIDHKGTKEHITRNDKRIFIKNDFGANFNQKQQFLGCIGFINDKINVLISIAVSSEKID